MSPAKELQQCFGYFITLMLITHNSLTTNAGIVPQRDYPVESLSSDALIDSNLNNYQGAGQDIRGNPIALPQTSKTGYSPEFYVKSAKVWAIEDPNEVGTIADERFKDVAQSLGQQLSEDVTIDALPNSLLRERQILLGSHHNSASPIKRKWGSNKMAAWGKRSPQEENKRWASGGMQAWGKRSDSNLEGTKEVLMMGLGDLAKRAWSKNMAAWGKRSDSTELGDILDEDKRWAQDGMQAWGKRDAETADRDKRWSKKMQAWGKRSYPSSGLQKRWAKGMNAWGKRNDDDDDNSLDSLENEKRWAKMQAWGKRDQIDDILDSEKRWAKSMNAWGKRNDENGAEKRWSKSMSSWGKRDGNSNTQLASREKRNNIISASTKSISAHANPSERHKRDLEDMYDLAAEEGIFSDIDEHKRSMSGEGHVWGKRTKYPFFGGPKRAWRDNAISSWGKRAWHGSGMSAWGKRSGNEDNMYPLDDIKRSWQRSMSVWG